MWHFNHPTTSDSDIPSTFDFTFLTNNLLIIRDSLCREFYSSFIINSAWNADKYRWPTLYNFFSKLISHKTLLLLDELKPFTPLKINLINIFYKYLLHLCAALKKSADVITQNRPLKIQLHNFLICERLSIQNFEWR